MKKAIDILLRVGKIVDIVVLVIVAVVGVIVLPISLIVTAAGIAAEIAEGGDAELLAAIGGLVVNIVQLIIYLVLCIVALVLLKKINRGYAVAKNKEENKKWAIMAIVSGALSTGLVLVAGILMLLLPEDQLPGYQAPAVEAEVKE